MSRRVLAIGLDGFEITLAERFIGEGLMPNFARIAGQSVRCELEHGADKFSGLAWEHVSTGRAPHDGARWSAVTFDKERYTARQQPTAYRPFLADLPRRSVVIDLPYCDLAAAPNVQGMTDWGAHDPGTQPASRPATLRDEVAQRFGPYPAPEWIYGFSWPSVERTRLASAALTRAVEQRSAYTKWLLAERLPGWDLAITVVSEPHSAIEPLWHGVDASHPLHRLPSAVPAANGLRDVYAATDTLIGSLADAFPDAALVLFAMHGMGTNDADVPTMALLPELLHRVAFGKPHMRGRRWTEVLPDGTPLLSGNDGWEDAIAALVPLGDEAPRPWLRALYDRLRGRSAPTTRIDNGDPAAMAWMPATRYEAFWPRMRAFAIPSFYDGRIRLNVEGRESRGIVTRGAYRETQQELAAILRACRDSISGEEIIADIVCHEGALEDVGPSAADMTVLWRGRAIGLRHPSLGTVGPLPWRRTGGHTGASGFCYVRDAHSAPRHVGRRSSFDVVPTLVALAGVEPWPGLSGRPLAELDYSASA